MLVLSKVDYKFLNLPKQYEELVTGLDEKLRNEELALVCVYRSGSEGTWRGPAWRRNIGNDHRPNVGPGYLEKGPGYTFNTLIHLEIQAVLDRWYGSQGEEINRATGAIVKTFEDCHPKELRDSWPEDHGHSYMLSISASFAQRFYAHLYDEQRQVRTNVPRAKKILELLPNVGNHWTRADIDNALEKAIQRVDALSNDVDFSKEEITWCGSYRGKLEQARTDLHYGDDHSGEWTHMEGWSALMASWLAKWAVHKETKDLHKRVVCGREFQIRSVLISFEPEDMKNYLFYTMADTNIMRKNSQDGPSMPVEVPFAAYAVEDGATDPGVTIYGTHPKMAMDFSALMAKPWDYTSQAPFASLAAEPGIYHKRKHEANRKAITENLERQEVFVDPSGRPAKFPTAAGSRDADLIYNYQAYLFDYITQWRLLSKFS